MAERLIQILQDVELERDHLLGPRASGPPVRARRARSHARAADWLFAIGLAFGLAWTPFWFGGAWRLPWGVNALIFPGLAFGYEIALLSERREHPLPAREIAAPAALFLIVVVWILAQTAPLPFAPAIAALGEETPRTLSVDPGATAIALTRLLTDAAAFWLAAQLGRNEAVNRRLLQAIMLIAALYSAAGVFLAGAFDNAIPGFAPADGGGEVRSTFVNRNSFAAYAGLGLTTILALLVRDGRPKAAVSPLASWLDATATRSGAAAAGLVVLAALCGTGSRGGILSAAVGVAALFGLVAERRRRRGESHAGLWVGLLALVAAFGVLGGPIAARLAGAGLADAGRLPVYRIVLGAILDRPFAGSGYGAFAEVFPLYRDARLSPVGVWEMAHNAYLEAALGLGLVFATLMTLAIALLAFRCFAAALRRNREVEAPLAAAAAAALVAVNALIDYSVQIEAVSLAFMTLLGLGVAQASRPAATSVARC